MALRLSALRSFFDWLVGQGELRSQCDAAQVRSFAVRSRRAGLGPASLALRLSALRSFFDWLVGQGEL
ncbi:hypothetical protein CKQ90_34570, partial [Klebsiella pneumoniae]